MISFGELGRSPIFLPLGQARATAILPLVHPRPSDYHFSFLRGESRGIGVLNGQITVTAPDVDALAGAPAGVGSVAGLPALGRRLAAVAAGSGSSSAQAILSLALAGLAQGAGVASAQFGSFLGLTGAPAGVGTVAGQMQFVALLSAVAAGIGSLSGAAVPSGAIMGSLAGLGAMTGAVQASLQESGSAGGLGAVAGGIQAELDESGVAIGVGTAAAATLAALALLGSGQGVGSAAAAIQAVLSVAGIAAGAGAASAAVSALLAEAGTAAGAGAAVGALTDMLSGGGTAAGVGAATGAVTLTVPYILDATTGTRPTAWATARSVAATYVDAGGNTEYPDNNFIKDSEAIGSGNWGFQGTATQNATTTPDGAAATLWVPPSGGANGAGNAIAQSYSTTLNGIHLIIGMVIKGAGFTSFLVQDGAGMGFTINTSTGVMTASGCDNMVSTSLGGGWWECTARIPFSSGGGNWYGYCADAGSGDGVKGFYLSKARIGLVINRTSCPYVKTTSAVKFAERLDHNATTPFALLGLLITSGDTDTFTIPTGKTALTFTFDDGSTQTVTGLTGGSTYTIPTTLNRSRIKYIAA